MSQNVSVLVVGGVLTTLVAAPAAGNQTVVRSIAATNVPGEPWDLASIQNQPINPGGPNFSATLGANERRPMIDTTGALVPEGGDLVADTSQGARLWVDVEYDTVAVAGP